MPRFKTTELVHTCRDGVRCDVYDTASLGDAAHCFSLGNGQSIAVALHRAKAVTALFNLMESVNGSDYLDNLQTLFTVLAEPLTVRPQGLSQSAEG